MDIERMIAFRHEFSIKMSELYEIITAKNTTLVQVCIQATYIKGMLHTAQICGFIDIKEVTAIENFIDHEVKKAQSNKKL